MGGDEVSHPQPNFFQNPMTFDGEWYGNKGLSIHLQEAQIQSLSNLNDIEAS